MVKICNKCNLEKDIILFQRVKSNKDGLSYSCKACLKEYTSNYYIKNKENLKHKNKEYVKNNKENISKYNGELNYGWDIDHIIPISSATSQQEILKLNHYTNLQPLCSYTNRYIKKDKLIYENF